MPAIRDYSKAQNPFGGYSEDTAGRITLAVKESSVPELIYPDAAIEYALKEGASFWLWIIGLVLIYSVAGVFLTIDFTKIVPISLGALKSAVWPRILFAVVQAVSLVGIFRRIGKKVL